MSASGSLSQSHKSVIVIAAHPDDEVLGCGGTIARLVQEGSKVHVLFLADGESSRSARGPVSSLSIEARSAAANAACRVLGGATVEMLSLPDNRLDSLDLLDLVQRIEAVMARTRPSLVLTHHYGDVNIDHRLAHEAVLVACRPQPGHFVRELMFFEVASSTEWRPPGSGTAFTPNCFVDITATLTVKLEALGAYVAEMREFPHARSIDAIRALAQWRGASAGVPAAEAFMIGRRIIH